MKSAGKFDQYEEDMDDLSAMTERKRKNDDSNLDDLAPDDVVDLDAMVQRYNTKRKNEQIRLEEEDDDEAAAVNMKRSGPKSERELNFEARMEAFGKRAEAWGENFGKRAEIWAERMGKRFGDSGEKWGKDMGGRFESFFKRPFDPDHQAEHVDASPEERNVAALAHGSIALSAAAGVFSAGILSPLFLVLPLVLYAMYRDRSSFVARHALHAFVAQLAATFGWIALVTGGAILAVILTIVLAITIVGILVIPFLWLGYVLAVLASLAIPVGTFIYSVMGIFAALAGRTFDYPYVSRWMNRAGRRRAKSYREV